MISIMIGMSGIISPVVNETLQEKAYTAIRNSIMKNDLLPGQSLLIDELSRKLGVSPTPVREALTRLMSDGLVERRRNKTARVAEITKDDVGHTYEVRKLLEPYGASLTAKRLSSDHNLEGKLREVKEAAEEIQGILATGTTSLTTSQYEAYLGIDLQLHKIMLEALGDTLLAKVFSLVGNHSLRIRSFAEATVGPSRGEVLQNINKDHLMIIRAILGAKSEKVQEVVKQHLNNAEERTLQAITQSSLTGIKLNR